MHGFYATLLFKNRENDHSVVGEFNTHKGNIGSDKSGTLFDSILLVRAFPRVNKVHESPQEKRSTFDYHIIRYRAGIISRPSLRKVHLDQVLRLR